MRRENSLQTMTHSSHVEAVVVKDLEGVTDLTVQLVVLVVDAARALIGMGVVPAVRQLEAAGVDVGDALFGAVDDLGDLAQVPRHATVEIGVCVIEAAAVRFVHGRGTETRAAQQVACIG